MAAQVGQLLSNTNYSGDQIHQQLFHHSSCPHPLHWPPTECLSLSAQADTRPSHPLRPVPRKGPRKSAPEELLINSFIPTRKSLPAPNRNHSTYANQQPQQLSRPATAKASTGRTCFRRRQEIGKVQEQSAPAPVDCLSPICLCCSPEQDAGR